MRPNLCRAWPGYHSPVSLKPTLSPRISRWPSALIPTAIITVVDRTACCRRTFTCIASTMRKGQKRSSLRSA